MTLTEAVLRAKLQTIQRRLVEDGSHKRCIGVLGDGWAGPELMQLEGAQYRVVFCGSSLAVREAMDGVLDDGPRLVVVTNCADSVLGADVQSRVFLNRFHAIDPWQTVRELFQATRLGPGVPQEPWLRDELVASTAEQRPALLAGTVLDLETVKQVVFRRLGFPRGAVDLRSLIVWGGSDAAQAFAGRDEKLRNQVRSWIGDALGRAGEAILDCVSEGHGERVLPLGLVLRVLVGEGMVEAGQREGLARAERFVGERRLVQADVAPWADEAEGIFRSTLTGDVRHHREVVAEADRLVGVMAVQDMAHRSTFLKEGLRQRERQFAAALEAALVSGTRDLVAVEAAADLVLKHELARVDRARVLDAAVTMSVRLLRWLRRPGAMAVQRGFIAEALAYAREGSFVDWAREQTTLGYPHSELQQALRKLWFVVQERRERENRVFAEACVAWHQLPETHPELIPLEKVLSEVVRPLAEQLPVLLVVMDGMSLAVFQELSEGLPKQGWLEIGPAVEEERGARRFGIAVLPTVTEVSRTSLLTGGIRLGGQEDELREFEGSQLLQFKGQKPRLFHKGTLSSDRLGLGPEVADAMRGTNRVVGVVLNVVDDWLGKGSEDGARWEIERIKSLIALLDVAEQSGRVVVMTSDHGHVRDHDSRYVQASGGTRWRSAVAKPADGEVLVRGPRVCLASGEQSVVLPWTESVRYSPGRQNGYHGGISPQEVLVPIAVFTHAGSGLQIAGFAEVPPGLPSWWDQTEALTVAAPPAVEPRKSKANKAPMLPFHGGRGEQPSGREADVAALLGSGLFQAQKELHLRGYPGDDKLRLVLGALAERGGSMLIDALANHLDLARVRVQGMVASLRRVLNYDGTECLEFDAQSGTVKVHWSILRTLFDLEEVR